MREWPLAEAEAVGGAQQPVQEVVGAGGVGDTEPRNLSGRGRGVESGGYDHVGAGRQAAEQLRKPEETAERQGMEHEGHRLAVAEGTGNDGAMGDGEIWRVKNQLRPRRGAG